jgi:hypothetical protein
MAKQVLPWLYDRTSQASPICNEYHSIADGDDGKAIMWRVKIVEGKDRPKKPDENWAFPTKWEQKGYLSSVNTILEMTEP